jgi:hypothetical protein
VGDRGDRYAEARPGDAPEAEESLRGPWRAARVIAASPGNNLE